MNKYERMHNYPDTSRHNDTIMGIQKKIGAYYRWYIGALFGCSLTVAGNLQYFQPNFKPLFVLYKLVMKVNSNFIPSVPAFWPASVWISIPLLPFHCSSCVVFSHLWLNRCDYVLISMVKESHVSMNIIIIKMCFSIWGLEQDGNFEAL